jgi:hypothetical protein
MFAFATDLWNPALFANVGSAPAWVTTRYTSFGSNPDIAVDFVNDRSWSSSLGSASAAGLLNCVCNSVRYRDDNSGNWFAFAPNVLAYTNKGLRIWEQRMNNVLWNRDLTNAAWIKTNVTAVLNQTGIDNTANSASSITASAGNATVLQSITLASSARFQSAFVKRITGSGVINMTMDGGTTWTPVTVTGAWTRVSIATQTIANPNVGFQIVTNGDAIAVDFVQNEGGTFASPPALTTSAAVTTAAEVVTLTTVPTFGAACTIYAAGTPQQPSTGPANTIAVASDGSNNNRLQLSRSPPAWQPVISVGGSIVWAPTSGSWTQGLFSKSALAFASADHAYVHDGGAALTNVAAGIPAGLNQVNIGTAGNSTSSFFNGDISELAIWPNTRVPNANLISGTL